LNNLSEFSPIFGCHLNVSVAKFDQTYLPGHQFCKRWSFYHGICGPLIFHMVISLFVPSAELCWGTDCEHVCICSPAKAFEFERI